MWQAGCVIYASRLGRPCFFALVLLCAAAVLLRSLGQPVPGSALGALFALLFAAIALGNFYPPSGIFGRPLLRGSPSRPLVALTFDDGPDPVSTPAVLAVLRRHGAKATFFVIGERAGRHPELLGQLAAEGHQIENHSLRHSWATPFLPRAQLAAELAETQRLIERACGRAPRWFRPPIGILSPPVAAAARRVGLSLCGWSCKSRDGLGSTGVAEALGRLRGGLLPGAILLLHDAAEGGARTPVAPLVLEQLLPLIQERGLRPVTLDELVGTDAGTVASPKGNDPRQ